MGLEYERYNLSLENFKQTIQECWFNYDDKCKQIPENFFIGYEDSEFGTCIRFNSGKNMLGHSVPLLNSTIGGMDDSLLLVTISTDFLVWVHDSKKPVKKEFKNNHQGEINFVAHGSDTHIIILSSLK